VRARVVGPYKDPADDRIGCFQVKTIRLAAEAPALVRRENPSRTAADIDDG